MNYQKFIDINKEIFVVAEKENQKQISLTYKEFEYNKYKILYSIQKTELKYFLDIEPVTTSNKNLYVLFVKQPNNYSSPTHCIYIPDPTKYHIGDIILFIDRDIKSIIIGEINDIQPACTDKNNTFDVKYKPRVIKNIEIV